MELVPKAEFSIVTRASSKAWIPELIAAAGLEVTETLIDVLTAKIRNRKREKRFNSVAAPETDQAHSKPVLGTLAEKFTLRLALNSLSDRYVKTHCAGISDSRQRASRMRKSIRLTNHTDCRAEPHIFGLHWMDVASRGEC